MMCHGVSLNLPGRSVEGVVPRLGRADEVDDLYIVAVPEEFNKVHNLYSVAVP